jgi:DNA-binding GntR family transcriptional regulator
MAVKPVARTASLRERAAIAIRAAIVTGEIRPGEIYSAPSLAQTLGVSATPVREAMVDLASDGLVEAVRNRGFRVIPLTRRDLDEIFELRLYLEVPAVVAIAHKPHLLDEAKVRRLRALVVQLEAAAEEGDLPGLIEADRRFHVELLELSENRRLVELVDRLRSYTRRYGMRTLDRASLFTVAADHERILEALLAGDAAAVQRVMEEHLAANRGILAGDADDAEPASAQTPALAN